jgi:hypothetical protein
MVDETLYEKDDLADYARLSNVTDSGGRYSGPSRQTLLKDALGVEVKSVCSGGYQGTWLFILVVNDTLWLLKDSYGSCSYCDGLMGASGDDAVRDYAENMMRNAYAFESKNDAVRFLHQKIEEGYGSWGWPTVADEGIETLAYINY